MKIGIIGSGGVAQALAKGYSQLGHEVLLGTRDAGKLAAFGAATPKARVGSVREAAAFAEVAVLAVKGAVAVDALRGVAAELAGKTVLDTTNPIADAAPVAGVLSYFTGPNDSLLERLQQAAPAVRLVKAFNSVGIPSMIHPKFAGGPPTMFIAGDDAQAKREAAGLIEALGWDVADMGPAVAARAIEPLCMLWCIPGFAANDWSHAFKLLR
jgi:8-hydroxy-5-deazaflavin:NADPH oxidoreductase